MKRLLALLALAALGFGGWLLLESPPPSKDAGSNKKSLVASDGPSVDGDIGSQPGTTPDGQQKTVRIERGAGETRLALDNGISVTIPAGVVTVDAALTVKHRSPSDMLPTAGGLEPIGAVDVELGEVHELDTPARIEFPLPAASTVGKPWKDALVCRYHNPDIGNWGAVPCTVDDGRDVAVITTDHLSTFGVFKILSGFDSEKFEHNSCKFRMIWDEEIPDLAPRKDAITQSLETACDKYAEAGFTIPDYRVDVVLLNDPPGKDPKYDGDYLYGYIQIPIRPLSVQSVDQAKHDAAHELFHAVQNTELNSVRLKYRHWFVEATAEYAAGFLVYPQAGLVSKLDATWPYLALCAGEDSHAYGSAHFINYVLEQSGRTLLDLWKAIVREGPQWAKLETTSFAGTFAQGAKGRQETFDAIARFLVAEPLDLFLTRNVPPSGTGNALVDLRRDYIAQALFRDDLSKRSQLLQDRTARLETVLDNNQMVLQFYPYDVFLKPGTRVPSVVLPGDYSAIVWRLDARATFGRQPRTLLLEEPKQIPEGVDIAIYANPRGKRLSKVKPLALVSHSREAIPVVLPPDNDLFVIAVNSTPEPVTLPFLLNYLRPDDWRRIDVAATHYTIELPSWMTPESPTAGALWQVHSDDLVPVESVRLFKADKGKNPAELRAWFESNAPSRFASFAPVGSSKDITVAGVPALLREYEGKARWTAPKDVRLYHQDRVVRPKQGQTVTVPVRIAVGYIQKGEDSLVLEAVSVYGAATWLERTIQSLEGGIVEGGLVLKENFDSRSLDSKWFELIRATGSGVGFLPEKGSLVSMEPGFVRIVQEDMHNGGGIITKPFPVFEGNELVIRSRHRIHRRTPDFEGLTPHTLASLGVATGDMKGVLAATKYAHHDDYCGFFFSGHFNGPSIAPIWDTWFDQELRWNPATGAATLSINGQKPIAATLGTAQGDIRVFAHACGWYTGHVHDLDDLEIRWVLAPNQPARPQTSPKVPPATAAKVTSTQPEKPPKPTTTPKETDPVRNPPPEPPPTDSHAPNTSTSTDEDMPQPDDSKDDGREPDDTSGDSRVKVGKSGATIPEKKHRNRPKQPQLARTEDAKAPFGPNDFALEETFDSPPTAPWILRGKTVANGPGFQFGDAEGFSIEPGEAVLTAGTGNSGGALLTLPIEVPYGKDVMVIVSMRIDRGEDNILAKVSLLSRDLSQELVAVSHLYYNGMSRFVLGDLLDDNGQEGVWGQNITELIRYTPSTGATEVGFGGEGLYRTRGPNQAGAIRIGIGIQNPIPGQSIRIDEITVVFLDPGQGGAS